MPNATTSSHLAGSGRLHWPDLAKGIAIILVVVGHVLGGLMAGDLIPEEPNGRWLHQWLYLFHIPTFFFASGWLVESRSSRRGGIQMKPLAASLLYPYFLWGTIIWAVHWLAAAAGIANHPVDPWTPLRLFYAASSGPWFLLILFLFHAVNRALGSTLRRPLWLLAISVGAFADYAMCSHVEFDTTRCLFELNAVFYALGVFACGRGWLREGGLFKSLTLVSGLVLLGLLAWVSASLRDLPPWSRLPLGMLGIAGVLGLSFGLVRVSGTQWLGWLGRNSLAIYLLHGFVPPVMRWFLARHLNVTNGPLLLVAGTAGGVLFSVLVAKWVAHWQVGWIFRFGNSYHDTPPGVPRRSWSP